MDAAAGTDISESPRWHGFRGAGARGIGLGGNYPSVLDTTIQRWQAKDVATGHSSPVVTETRIFLTGEREKKPVVMCYDRRSGERLWESPVPATRDEPRHNRNRVATATPATDGENVFAFFGNVGLVAFDGSGTERWKVALGPFTTAHGSGSSPVLVGNNVVVQADSYGDSFIAAYDRKTGEERWKKERPLLATAYTTPIVRKARDGVFEIIAVGSYEVIAYDARTGDKRWEFARASGTVVPSPVLDGDVLITANRHYVERPEFTMFTAKLDKDKDGVLSEGEFGTGNTAILLRRVAQEGGNKDGKLDQQEFEQGNEGMIAEGQVLATRLNSQPDGTVRPETLWSLRQNVPEATTPLLVRKTLYIVHNGVLTTLDADRGPDASRKLTRLTGALGNYFASPVAGGTNVYLLSEEGKAVVIDAGAEAGADLKLSVFDLGEPCYATPALVDGQVFVRTDKSLYCFGAETKSAR